LFIKKFLSGALFFAGSIVCSAQVVWFTPDVSHTISGGLILDNNTGFSPYVDSDTKIIPSYFLSYTVETPQLYSKTGTRFSAKTADLTTRVVYWPLFWNRLNAGVGFTYHFLAYDKKFFEQDMLAGLFFRYKHRSFTLTADIDYFRKWTRIYAVQDYIPWLTNNSMAVNTQWSWFVLDHLDFYFGISSYSTYQYLLFWAPDFMTGFDWHFAHGIIAGAEFNIQYVDMMTLSSYLDSVELRLFTKWTFK
jgi:hypothetical protein